MIEDLNHFMGGTVLECKLGEGTFLFLKLVVQEDAASYEIWVYLANWRIVSNAGDILFSADELPLSCTAGHVFSEFQGQIVDFSFDHEEYTLSLGTGMRLSIVSDEKVSKGDDLFSIYKNGKFSKAYLAP